MATNVLLLHYNNYFNRTIKKLATVDEYKAADANYSVCNGVNFVPGDGIITSLVLGFGNNPSSIFDDGANYDYLVVMDSAAPDYAILSRWFIMEENRTRDGQFELELRRDVIADNLQSVLSAKTFIEKGHIDPANDYYKPLLYNNESMTYNQIKKNEILLKDKTQVPWIVGYIASNSVSESTGSLSTGVTLSASGSASGTWSTYSTGLTVDKITILNQYSEDTKDAEPYGTSSAYMFEASYNSANGQVQYRINIPGWSNAMCTIRLYKIEPLSIESKVTYPVESAIEASDLPWTFDPAATKIAGVKTYKVMNTAINIVNNKASYRYVWFDTTCTPTSPSTFNKSTTVTSGNLTAWPAYAIDEVYFMYTTASSGSGDWSTYGNANALRIVAPGIAPSYIVDKLRTQGYSLTGDGLSAPNAYQYNGSIIHYGTKYYRIDVQPKVSQTVRVNEASHSDAIWTAYQTACATSASAYNTRVSGDILKLQMNSHTPSNAAAAVTIDVNVDSYDITATEITSSYSVSTSIPTDASRCHLNDAPYDMFAIPYGDITVTKTDSVMSDYTVDKDMSMSIALEMAKDIGTDKLYDIQLLPYCPCEYMINEDGEIDLSKGIQGSNYDLIVLDESGTITNKSVILWANSSSGTFDITTNIELEDEDEDDAINIKINNECDVYRLVSPNFNGMFEFSLAKNGGSVNKVNVDYTYRPYSPYIHLNPDFKGLYGSDFNDTRGLILSGDFSLPMISDAWVEYQTRNKNYQEIFDRQIQNMDVNNQIALDQQNISAVLGTLTGGIGGAAAGALAGGKAGGPYGALAGAVIGGVGGTALGIAGGIMDREFLLRQQQESKRYAIDMYGYGLKNVQALPYSLAKSSALTNNNKLFPLIEFYSCTDIEKEALKEKILADGMTVMVVDEIRNFVRSDLDLSFIRGSIIRLSQLSQDNHMAEAISQEIQKGVYMTPGIGA